MAIEYSARCHVGRVRENNEDNLYVNGVTLPSDNRDCPFTIDGRAGVPAIFAVCDGMGGEENGEAASLAAVENLVLADSFILSAGIRQLENAVQTLINNINCTIRLDSRTHGSRAGTTIALAVVSENGIHCFNMGDSRIYALYKSGFKQITNDHTLSGTAGHKLTRCIGIGDILTPESYQPLPFGSRILICSDGLTDMVSADKIEKILRGSERTVTAADYLLNTALTNGGRDNVTVIVADIIKMPFFRVFAKKLKG